MKGGRFMAYTNYNDIVIKTNERGDKVNQTQARAIKTDLTRDFIKDFSAKVAGVEVMYDSKGKQVITFANGLIFSVDFTIHALTTELTVDKPTKVAK